MHKLDCSMRHTMNCTYLHSSNTPCPDKPNAICTCAGVEEVGGIGEYNPTLNINETPTVPFRDIYTNPLFDQVAIAAMQGILANEYATHTATKNIRKAFLYAQAFMAERERRLKK